MAQPPVGLTPEQMVAWLAQEEQTKLNSAPVIQGDAAQSAPQSFSGPDSDLRNAAASGAAPPPPPGSSQQQPTPALPPSSGAPFNIGALSGLNSTQTTTTSSTPNTWAGAQGQAARKGVVKDIKEAQRLEEESLKSQAEAESAKRTKVQQIITAQQARVGQEDAAYNSPEAQKQRQDREKYILDTQKRLDEEDKALGNFEVQPDRFIKNMTGVQKAVFLISAGLTGFAQGFRGQSGPNPTLALVQGIIDKDIDNQESAYKKKAGAHDRASTAFARFKSEFKDSEEARVRMRIFNTQEAIQAIEMVEKTPVAVGKEDILAGTKAQLYRNRAQDAITLQSAINPGQTQTQRVDAPLINAGNISDILKNQGELDKLPLKSQTDIKDRVAGLESMKAGARPIFALLNKYAAKNPDGSLVLSQWTDDDASQIKRMVTAYAAELRSAIEKGVATDADVKRYEGILGLGFSPAEIMRNATEVRTILTGVIDSSTQKARAYVNSLMQPYQNEVARLNQEGASLGPRPGEVKQ